MKRNEKKKAYVEPQIMMYALAGECPILAGSPPISTTPTVVPPYRGRRRYRPRTRELSWRSIPFKM